MGSSRRAALAAVLAASAVAGCGGTESEDRPETEAIRAETVVLAPTARIRVEFPSAMAVGFGSLWVAGHRSETLVRIDPEQNKVIATIDGIGYQTSALVVHDGAVWAAAAFDGLTKVDPRTNRVVKRIRGNFAELTVGFGSLWADDFYNRVVRIDPRTGRPIAKIPLGSHAGVLEDGRNWVAIGEGAVWVGVRDDTVVYRIDPRTNRVVATIDSVGRLSSGAVAAGEVWVTAADGRLRTIDPRRNRVTLAAVIGGRSEWTPLTAAGDTLWINAASKLHEFDVRARRLVGTYSIGVSECDKPPAVAFGSVWCSDFDGSRVLRFDPPS